MDNNVKSIFADSSVLEACKNNTIKTFEGKIPQDELDNLIMSSIKSNATIGASVSFVSAVVWTKFTCKPNNMPWIYEANAWGAGIGGGSCEGFMYNAYKGNDWDTFFKEAVGFHIQGVAEVGGILQITWIKSGGTPIGQFNGFLAGAGALEMGGSGKWKSK